mmetsp:Transcript_19542/g.48674  ORF Transcript_19542/g.48674 Transcript_19542/m.48674 type:complete len:205 (+) Transcript_19542:119-733(+)
MLPNVVPGKPIRQRVFRGSRALCLYFAKAMFPKHVRVDGFSDCLEGFQNVFHNSIRSLEVHRLVRFQELFQSNYILSFGPLDVVRRVGKGNCTDPRKIRIGLVQKVPDKLGARLGMRQDIEIFPHLRFHCFGCFPPVKQFFERFFKGFHGTAIPMGVGIQNHDVNVSFSSLVHELDGRTALEASHQQVLPRKDARLDVSLSRYH